MSRAKPCVVVIFLICVITPLWSASPVIKATKTIKDQAGNLGTTAVFTPTADGVYRVSVYISATAGTGSGNGQVGFVDDSENAQSLTTFLGFFVGAPGSFSFPIKAKANHPITIGTYSVSSSLTYNVYVVVESL